MTGAIRREFNSSCRLMQFYVRENRKHGFGSLFSH